MQRVNAAFGVGLIGAAIYLLGTLPQVPVLLLWAAFLLVLGAWFGLLDAGRYAALSKGAGRALTVWGAVALIGGLAGQRDPFDPLPPQLFAAVTGAPADNAARPAEHVLARVNDLDALASQFRRAAEQQKPIMIDYYADWCIDCVKMEKTTFADAGVGELLSSRFVALQVDVTDPNDEDRAALKKRFGVFGPPAVLFFDADGAPLPAQNFYGYRDKERFLAQLNDLL